MTMHNVHCLIGIPFFQEVFDRKQLIWFKTSITEAKLTDTNINIKRKTLRKEHGKPLPSKTKK